MTSPTPMSTMDAVDTDQTSRDAITDPRPSSPAEDASPCASGDNGAPANRWAQADEDVRLMLDFQNGNESAFATLVERNQARVFAMVHRFCAGRADVEDITQEVFLRVFRSAARYEPKARFTTWLYRIATNLCLSTLRSAGKLKTTPLRIATDHGESDEKTRELEDTNAPQPDESLQASELAQQVRAAIDKLPDNQRTAIILSRYENMSYDQISEVMEVSTMAVKSLLSRARTNLRSSLGPLLKS